MLYNRKKEQTYLHS